MLCTACWNWIDDDARFCEYCGKPNFANLTERKLKALQARKTAERQKAEEAGRLMRSGQICPRCGAQLPAGARFCGRCGRRIGE